MVLFQAQRLRELCQHFDNWRLTPDSKSGIADRDGAVYSRGSFQQMTETINSNGGCHAPLALRYRIPTFLPYGTVCCACAEVTKHDIFSILLFAAQLSEVLLFLRFPRLQQCQGCSCAQLLQLLKQSSSDDNSAVMSMLGFWSVLQNSSR